MGFKIHFKLIQSYVYMDFLFILIIKRKAYGMFSLHTKIPLNRKEIQTIARGL